MNVQAIRKTFHILNVIVICSLFAFASCMPGGSLNTKRSIASNSTKTGSGNTSGNGSSTAVADGTTTDTTTISSQKIELSHLVDPFTGSYKKKITIPKNYKGYMYIAGLNLSALSGKLVKVRLNFGVDRQSIVIPATLARAPGITPKTDIQVLVLDINKRLFQDMRLPYDLYDYADYNSDSTIEPITDPYDGNLYCRGLKNGDDPTFVSSSSTCSSATDKCLYSYAKISDASFYDGAGLTSTPTRPAIWTTSTVFNSALVNGMCLADYSVVNYTSLFGGFVPSGMNYQGPYRPIGQSSWTISSNALFANELDATSTYRTYYGLFETGVATDRTSWYRSLLFPRAGKISLNSGINYIGSTSKFGARAAISSDSTGTSQYIDGCNIRAQNYDSSVNEGIGSCNVIANIEIFYMKDTSEVNITTSNDLKIQLTRASITNSEGKQVLSSSFKTCESSASCGSEECCFNKRCWSKDLVSQCVDDVAATGNRELGTSCTSDYQCASLCCNSSTGACSAHTPNSAVPVLCSKSAGQACVSQEFCAKEYVPVCKLYKNGYNADGTIKCTVRCPTVATYGTCLGGSCIAPKGLTDTTSFDLTTCAGAVDP